MSDRVKLLPGDVYCVRCLGERLSMRLERGDEPTWDCDDCHRTFTHPFHADAEGRFAWTWDEKHPKPNPGCPWCGTCNIRGVFVTSRGDGEFSCQRQSCRKFWRGGFTGDRWKLHVPVGTVPWASGTTADLECHRRFGEWPLCTTEMYDPNCCRWPKSCSAFDPGFTVGKGPTTLPIVWFDGFGWRSGLPDARTIPEHLFADIWARWLAVRPSSPEEASDDDGDDTGCGDPGCDCYDAN